MKEDSQKAFKKLTLCFLLNPVPFNRQKYQKQEESWTSDQSLFRLQNRFRKIPLLVSYILSDQVWCLIKQVFSYSKKYICKFMQASSWHHKLFHFHLFFWVWKLWKGRENFTKVWISRERKELLRWNKKHFSVFERLSFGEKIKIWWKIADTSLKRVLT